MIQQKLKGAVSGLGSEYNDPLDMKYDKIASQWDGHYFDRNDEPSPHRSVGTQFGVPGVMLNNDTTGTLKTIMDESMRIDKERGGDGTGKSRMFKSANGPSNLANDPRWWLQATSQGPFKPNLNSFPASMRGLDAIKGSL